MKLCLAHGGDLSEPSGGHDRITAIAAGLAERGVEVTIVAPQPTGNLPDRLADIRFVPVPIGTRGVSDQPARALLVSRRARAVAREQGATLQIVHSTLAGVATLLGCSGFVLDMHDLAFASPLYGDLPFGSAAQWAINRLEGRAVRAAAEVVVVSEHMRELAVTRWNLPDKRFTVIPNGYFPESIAPYRDIDPVDGRVVFLGTLHPKVDTDAFVAIAQLPSVKEMIVIGDGERRAELDTVSDSTLSLRVTGRLPDEEAFSLLASAAVAVNPQHSSDLQAASSPVKLYYYAAAGRPMVLTEGPEAARWLAEEGAATLVSHGDPFTEAVAALLNEPSVRQRMSTTAVRAGEAATWERRVERIAHVHGVDG